MNAFDTNLLNDKKLSSTPKSSNDQLLRFDTELLDEKQFMSLINSYMMQSFISSEVLVNDFIAFLKDSYVESLAEKNLKLEKVISFKLRIIKDFLV